MHSLRWDYVRVQPGGDKLSLEIVVSPVTEPVLLEQVGKAEKVPVRLPAFAFFLVVVWIISLQYAEGSRNDVHHYVLAGDLVAAVTQVLVDVRGQIP